MEESNSSNQHQEVLKHKLDHYNSAHVDAKDIPELSAENFKLLLEKTIIFFKSKLVKGFWIQISMQQLDYLPILRDRTFTFHHTTDNKVVLSAWLREDISSRLPSFSTHYAGVGGVVIDRKNKCILNIKEKNGRMAGMWTIPGGLVDRGEQIKDAAEREVIEETGIKTRALGVLAFRERKEYQLGMNDIYFIVLLEPLTLEHKLDEREVMECQWRPLKEYYEESFKSKTQAEIQTLLKKIFEEQLNKAEDLSFEGIELWDDKKLNDNDYFFSKLPVNEIIQGDN